MRAHLAIPAAACLLIAAAAGLAATTLAAAPAAAPAPPPAAPPPYAPGLGDFMTAYVQPHHIKLWLAGMNQDWTLATYESSELGETFDDVATYQATWKNVPVAKLVKAMIDPALKKVDAAIASKNPANFRAAYETLTMACNSCHVAAGHNFVEVAVPLANPYPDQKFDGH